MAEERNQRRLAAILAADVVGYSKLMGLDESGTLSAFKAHRHELVDAKIAEHQGRIVKLTGDGLLVEFPSVVNAVACAADIQHKMRERNADVPADRRIEFRIGINLGDIIIDDDDIFGDGVNIAARIESIARPGGVAVSGSVRDSLGNRLALTFEDTGEQTLKNIERPVRVYNVNLFPDAPFLQPVGVESVANEKPSIAVLPFNNMSGDPEQEYFSDGITEDVITELSRFHSLLVIARHSSFAFKGQAIEVKEFGRKMGARYVVEGSVRKSGNRIRVTSQLVDAVTGSHVWAERYDRDLLDLFGIQDELASAVASTVGGRVEAAWRERAVRLSPSALKAYDLVLRARAFVMKFTRSDTEEARMLTRHAIEIDPTSSQAHAYYAYCCFVTQMAHWSEDRDRLRNEAIEFAKRAVTLDDADNNARWILGMVHNARGEYEEARFHLEKAVQNNPNDTEARGYYAYFLHTVGQPEAAIEQFELSKRQNPYDFTWFPWGKGWAYFTARRYGDAIASLKSIPEPINEVRGILAASYAYAGRLAEAKAMLEEFLRVAEDDMAAFPGRRLKDWDEFWRGAAWYQHQEDHDHLMDGLGKAGLLERRTKHGQMPRRNGQVS
ncbi:hypothetical protein X740_28390 [Mesorhizobium sp. LNHC221B00]|uniref:tetratricopeptide repeat protein n=1 Tax=Mesorhizobium sp. LNHC221B00 TaxID=1287233 RepID=UPI0003CEFE85|nr:adenylate/guanylate cyclase domain-containing protein [Mesorhizobium sp. LNHC221B00]ESY76544.1 hypothetical protein X740_28390 [Mesorhizobium sp. LNHC221B00]